ncbi:MAG: hypothetical protein AB7H77_03555 [Bdellovibrionales bacterium]
MISYLKNRIYRNKVLKRIEELCLDVLGKEDGGFAMGLFAMQTRYLVEQGNLDLSGVIAAYRRARQSIDESAISFIDGTITQLKQTRDINELEVDDRDSLSKGIMLLEKVIDKSMLKSGGKIGILPRNGQFAQNAEKIGLSEFFAG